MMLAVFTINVMLEITANHSVNNMLIEAIHFTQSFRFCFCFFTVKPQRNCGLLYPYIYSTLSFKNKFYIWANCVHLSCCLNIVEEQDGRRLRASGPLPVALIKCLIFNHKITRTVLFSFSDFWQKYFTNEKMKKNNSVKSCFRSPLFKVIGAGGWVGQWRDRSVWRKGEGGGGRGGGFLMLTRVTVHWGCNDNQEAADEDDALHDRRGSGASLCSAATDRVGYCVICVSVCVSLNEWFQTGPYRRTGPGEGHDRTWILRSPQTSTIHDTEVTPPLTHTHAHMHVHLHTYVLYLFA